MSRPRSRPVSQAPARALAIGLAAAVWAGASTLLAATLPVTGSGSSGPEGERPVHGEAGIGESGLGESGSGKPDGRRRAVALTFDDLPATAVVGGDCDAERLLELNRRLLAHLERFDAPAAGLVTASRVCDDRREEVLTAVLSLWLDAGHDLGNHTFSHPDLNNTPLADYERDVVRGEVVVRRLLEARGRPLRYFRHPLLHAGADGTKKEALSAFLERSGYTVAPVTIDNQEWIFAAVYARAKARGDRETMHRVASAYVPFMEEVFAFFEDWSIEVLGREIPQVLLLHANELNADHLDELIGMIRRRGYELIPLARALADEAYASEDAYVGPRGLSWLHRWAFTRGMELKEEPREPEWLAALLASG